MAVLLNHAVEKNAECIAFTAIALKATQTRTWVLGSILISSGFHLALCISSALTVVSAAAVIG